MRHKHKIDTGSPGVQLGLIVTPMLDMAFQILSFFIATYNPSMLEGAIPGSLVPPENPAMKSKDKNNVPNVENPLSVKEEDLRPELADAVLIRAKAIIRGEQTPDNRSEGSLGDIMIKVNSLQQEELLVDKLTSVSAAMKELQARLTKEMLKAGFETREERIKKGIKKSPNLKLAADGDLRQEFVMMVYSAAKRAGYDDIHFVPPPVLPSKINR